MNKKIIFGIIILFVITAIVLGFTVFNHKEETGSSYKKEVVKKGSIEALVVTTGSLNPVNIVDVGSQVSGRIDNLYADFNSIVKKEQIIAKLDQEIFLTRVKQNEANYSSRKAGLEKARITLENTKKKYDRNLNLFEKDLVSFEDKETSETQYYSSKADLQSAEASLEQAASTLESSKVDLSYTVIKSPINGVVINRNVNVGQTVAASLQAPVLFQIANDLSKMQVECSIDEADIGKIKEGQQVRFTVDAFPNENFSGKVSQVRYAPQIVQNVVTYTTIVKVGNPDLKLRPGMTATVSIVTGEAKNKLLVSNAAMRFRPSDEDMQKFIEEMRKRMEARSAASGHSEGNTTGRGERAARTGGQGMQGMQGMRGGRNRNSAQVWIEDENGSLQVVRIRTGVTNNSYTEIISGNLKEGQKILTGQNSSAQSSRNSNRGVSMGRGMMFIRR